MTFKYTVADPNKKKISQTEGYKLSPYGIEPFIPSDRLVKEEDFLEELAERAYDNNLYWKINKSIVKSVMFSLRELLIENAKDGKGTEMLFDFFQLMPVCNGFTVAWNDMDYPGVGRLSIDEVNPRISLVLSDSLQRDFLEELELERVDVDGNPLPHIHFDE